jgi:hypothetical protein
MKKFLIAASIPIAFTLPAHAQQRSLTPDEVAVIVGTVIVQQQQCTIKSSGFPLNVAVAKLGQDLVDFMPGNRYAPLVEVKKKKAVEFVGMAGKKTACAGFEGVLVKFLPDVYMASAPKRPAKD